jgi:archaellum component FlaC
MPQERTTWSDDRLDDLAGEIRALRKVIDNRFDRVDDRFDRVDDRFDRVDDRFDSQAARIEKRFDNLTYGLIYSMASLLAAFGGALVAIQV